MRVIAGTAKGHRLMVPGGLNTRPTADRVKEALFSVLADRVAGAAVLDLFAGSGALGIEALSRGADRGIFVDSSRSSIEAIHKNLIKTGLLSKAEVWRAPATRALDKLIARGQRFDLIFLDPPYKIKRIELEGILETVSREKLIMSGGMIVLEHSVKALSVEANSLAVLDTKKYGDTGLTFFSSD
jgi:16S rRNA (guanine966-N2)-methyltransferase